MAACPHIQSLLRMLSRLLHLLVLVMTPASGALAQDVWRGTAPFCDGACLEGEVEIDRNDRGDGSPCWSGTKALCRPVHVCQPQQTITSCYGVVQMCDDGFYTHPQNWKSCRTYFCGLCVGFDW